MECRCNNLMQLAEVWVVIQPRNGPFQKGSGEEPSWLDPRSGAPDA